MKRVMFLVMLIGVLLTGCSAPKGEQIELPETADNSGKRAIYFIDEERMIPLSITNDGEQQIQNGVYWFYELNALSNFEKNEEFYIYDFDSKLPIKKVMLDGLSAEQGYAANGAWKVFVAPIHTEYSKDSQASVDDVLVSEAKRLLGANKVDADAVVTDVWRLDVDGDGAEERFFEACNCLSIKERGKVGYCLLGYLDGEECQVLYSNYSVKIGEENEAKTMEPLICDTDGDGDLSVWLYRNGDYKSITSFEIKDGNFSKNYEIIF